MATVTDLGRGNIGSAALQLYKGEKALALVNVERRFQGYQYHALTIKNVAGCAGGKWMQRRGKPSST